MTARLFKVLLLSAALAQAGDPAPAPAITSAELLGHVQRLASDAWEGRGSGTEGERQATQYIADCFRLLDLEPAGEGGTYFQPVRMPAGIVVDPASTLALLGGPAPAPLALGREWTAFSASASGEVEADLVFAGYGITAPREGYDDYAGLDVKGKIVVVFRHAPHGTAFWDGPQARMRHAPFRAKLKEATDRGAAALVVVNDPFHFPGPGAGDRGGRPDELERGSIGGAQSAIPFVHLTLTAARGLFPAAFGATPEALEAAIHKGAAPAPASRAGRARARLSLAIERKEIEGRNVCALLPAGAPDATDEVVVIGAHHDHLGKGGGFGSLARSAEERTQIHNGADDNASGTSGLLEAAAYLAARQGELRRSILFLTFTGEERGLLGSRHWVEHPTLPLEHVAAMLNMDMIGRLGGRKLFIGGVKTSPAFAPLLEARAKEVGLDVVFGDGGRAPSDNSSFYDKGVPVLFFFSGMHEDYHRPSDDVDKLDLEGMREIAFLCALTADDLARLPARPAFQRADQGGAGPPRPVLGIRVAQGAEQGVQVGAVVPDGPAAHAGLRAGDVILAVAGTPTGDLGALRDALEALEIGQEVEVEVQRGTGKLTCRLTLGRG